MYERVRTSLAKKTVEKVEGICWWIGGNPEYIESTQEESEQRDVWADTVTRVWADTRKKRFCVQTTSAASAMRLLMTILIWRRYNMTIIWS